MANEVRFGWVAGQADVLADVFKPDGTEREFGVVMVETGQGRLYLGDCATIEPGDSIVIHQNSIYLSSSAYLGDQLNEIWRRFYKKTTATKDAIKTYTDGDAVRTTQTVTFDGKTKTVNNAS